MSDAAPGLSWRRSRWPVAPKRPWRTPAPAAARSPQYRSGGPNQERYQRAYARDLLACQTAPSRRSTANAAEKKETRAIKNRVLRDFGRETIGRRAFLPMRPAKRRLLIHAQLLHPV